MVPHQPGSAGLTLTRALASNHSNFACLGRPSPSSDTLHLRRPMQSMCFARRSCQPCKHAPFVLVALETPSAIRMNKSWCAFKRMPSIQLIRSLAIVLRFGVTCVETCGFTVLQVLLHPKLRTSSSQRFMDEARCQCRHTSRKQKVHSQHAKQMLGA